MHNTVTVKSPWYYANFVITVKHWKIVILIFLFYFSFPYYVYPNFD
jgi:hypothetical protein